MGKQQPDVTTDVDAADLFILAQRLQRLQSVTAPPRLRGRVLGYVWDTPAQPRVVPITAARSRGSAHVPLSLERRLGSRRSTVLALASRAAAAAAIVAFVGYGTFAASASSLPDSPLYSWKLAAEDIRVAVADTDSRPQIYAEQADKRLDETRQLIQNGNLPEAERTYHDAEARLESARATAAQSAHPQQSKEAIADVTVRAAAVADRVAQLSAPSISPRIQDSVPGFVPDASLRQPAAAIAPQPDTSASIDLSNRAPSGLLAPKPENGFVPVDSGAASSIAPSAPAAVAPRGAGAPSASFKPIDGLVPPPSTDNAASRPNAAVAAPQQPAARLASPVATPQKTASTTPASLEAPTSPFTLIPAQ